MNKIISLMLLLFNVLWITTTTAETKSGGPVYSLNLTVTEKGSTESIVMASCSLSPLGMNTVTNANGVASFTKIPEGRYTLEVRYVGYERYQMIVDVRKNLNLKVSLTPSSLALKEVVVTAQQKSSGAATTSMIGRQAIDHLQATSLADVMQLLPGVRMGNTDLTQQTNLQLRTLVNNNTSAFGSSVILDGMPMSNNGVLNQGTFSSSAFTGIDLRQISSDNIDNVEVIRGIPSAEYGDLTSGLVIVHSKVGVTPWQVKGKITPELQNYSLGKGFRLKRAGILNINLDYAKAWSDPRMKTRSYGRYTFNLGYAYDISKYWHTDTRVRLFYAKDWNGKDPDAIQDGSESSNKNFVFSLNHNGRITLNKLFARTLNYTLGATFTSVNNSNTSFVAVPNGFLPIFTATETGYSVLPYVTQSYQATGRTESRPGNIFAKINDSFYFHLGKTTQSFKVGADYRASWNSGRGYFNLDESRPYRPNSDGRPRAFSDVPALHQFSLYAEDNFMWNINRINHFRANFGLRFTSQQPFSNVSTTSLSPRLNLMFRAARWVDIRAGIGLNSKTPGLDYLYPDRKYADRIAVQYLPQDNPSGQLVMGHTYVYDVKYSKGLKNATTTKIELGVDFRLPGNRSLSIVAYRDRTPNGFSPLTDYITYYSNVYNAQNGLNITQGGATTVDMENPARRDLIFMTTGGVANENMTINKGIEFDFNLGEIKPIKTTIYFSGAYSETQTWNKGLNTSNPRAGILPTSYSSLGLTPYKIVYPSGLDRSIYRNFINTLRLVTNIPRLRMVASFTAQAIWYNYSYSKYPAKNPIGYITSDLAYHAITNDMMNGYLDMNGQYFAAAPSGEYIKISDLYVSDSQAVPSKSPITWNLQARLTKEFGRIGGLSLYVNNLLYYEPYLKTNLSSTLVQRNTGTFSYGVELFFNL